MVNFCKVIYYCVKVIGVFFDRYGLDVNILSFKVENICIKKDVVGIFIVYYDMDLIFLIFGLEVGKKLY